MITNKMLGKVNGNVRNKQILHSAPSAVVYSLLRRSKS